MQVHYAHVMQDCYMERVPHGAMGQRRKDRRFWMAYECTDYQQGDVCCAVMDDFGTLVETDAKAYVKPESCDRHA